MRSQHLCNLPGVEIKNADGSKIAWGQREGVRRVTNAVLLYGHDANRFREAELWLTWIR